MTKVREPLSPNHALDLVVGCIGWEAAERVTGRRQRAIRKWSEPDIDRGVPLEAALALDIAYVEATGAQEAPFEAFYRTRMLLARARATAAVANRAQLLADAHRETGEAFAAHALAGSGADDQVRRRVAREIDEAIVALSMIRDAGIPCQVRS